MLAAEVSPVAAKTQPTRPAVEVTHVTVHYAGQPAGTNALCDVTLSVGRGERLLLIGPNGAGKTSLMRVLSGLLRPSSGTVAVGGLPAQKARRLVGVVGHHTYLYSELTAEENLRFYADLYGVANPAERARTLLEEVGMLPLANERVDHLSRGQQQRIAVARALVHDPPVLLLDEPDTGLDLAAFERLERLVVRGDRTVVVTTHNLAAGVRLGTRAIVLDRGAAAERIDAFGDDTTSMLARLMAERTNRATAAR